MLLFIIFTLVYHHAQAIYCFEKLKEQNTNTLILLAINFKTEKDVTQELKTRVIPDELEARVIPNEFKTRIMQNKNYEDSKTTIIDYHQKKYLALQTPPINDDYNQGENKNEINLQTKQDVPQKLEASNRNKTFEATVIDGIYNQSTNETSPLQQGKEEEKNKNASLPTPINNSYNQGNKTEQVVAIQPSLNENARNNPEDTIKGKQIKQIVVQGSSLANSSTNQIHFPNQSIETIQNMYKELKLMTESTQIVQGVCKRLQLIIQDKIRITYYEITYPFYAKVLDVLIFNQGTSTIQKAKNTIRLLDSEHINIPLPQNGSEKTCLFNYDKKNDLSIDTNENNIHKNNTKLTIYDSDKLCYDYSLCICKQILSILENLKNEKQNFVFNLYIDYCNEKDKCNTTIYIQLIPKSYKVYLDNYHPLIPKKEEIYYINNLVSIGNAYNPENSYLCLPNTPLFEIPKNGSEKSDLFDCYERKVYTNENNTKLTIYDPHKSSYNYFDKYIWHQSFTLSEIWKKINFAYHFNVSYNENNNCNEKNRYIAIQLPVTDENIIKNYDHKTGKFNSYGYPLIHYGTLIYKLIENTSYKQREITSYPYLTTHYRNLMIYQREYSYYLIFVHIFLYFLRYFISK